jgi:hypothetical protein
MKMEKLDEPTPPMSPQDLVLASPMSPISPIPGTVFREVRFILPEEEKGQDEKLKTSRDLRDKEEGSAKRKLPLPDEEKQKLPNIRKKQPTFWRPKEEPVKHGSINLVVDSSSTNIPWSGVQQEGAWLVTSKSETLPMNSTLGWYAADRPAIPEKKFKASEDDPEAISYMVRLTDGKKYFYVDGSQSKEPSAKINHRWSFTNCLLQEDGEIITTCSLELFPETPVELLMNYGDDYWYHRLCKGHVLYKKDKDFDEISVKSQEELSAYMRVVLPDNVDKLTEEQQIVYMQHWDD